MRMREENRYAERSIAYFGSRGRTGGAQSKLESNSNAGVNEDRDDVVFVSSKESEASALWVNYLSACFEQISRQQGRPPFSVRHVTVEDSTATSSSIHEKIGKARLQIVVVCPGLLDRVATRPEQAANLARQLSPERVLAMMLGVHDAHLTDNHRSALINYALWRKFFVKDQDETFVGEFLGAAVAILGTTPAPALRNDKTTFSVHPKKVKMGQNRVLVILNDPLRPEDNVTVIVDRCGEAIEITHVKRRNAYVLQFSIPDRCLEVSMLVGVRVMINGCPQGVKQVKCESRLRELDQILRAHDNPLEFMCQTFGFNPGDREQLDNWMVNAFQKNLPPRFDLLSTPSGAAPLQRNQTSPEEYPTLLHFAARFGLEKLAWQLLECPGGDVACDIKNVAELTPADLAEQSNHTRLAHQLRGYMQMNEFTNMYSYLKVISESTSNPGAANESAPSINCGNSVCSENENDKEDYCRPRPLSEAYSVPPAARPITVSTSMNFVSPPQLPPPNPTTSPTPCEMNYSVLPPPTPVPTASTSSASNSQSNGFDLPLQGYLKMHPAGPKTPSPTGGSCPVALTGSMTSLRSQGTNHSSTLKREDGASTPTSGLSRTASSSGSKSRETSGPQDELLEIINDFKNNVFTISEVERLVDNWRNRNDVQQSFKDKQRQLTAMRDEYERIQKRIKDEMKAPTPFDRIKKFFTKTKKDTKDSSVQGEDASSTTSKAESANGSSGDRRPMSSLSLHSVSSSSSSGRMSIISGCSGTSLGDSGTHSDPEDRRVLRGSREDKGGVMAYEIPPAPKPFTGRYSPMRYTASPRCLSTNNEHDNRRAIPGSQPPEGSEYYIAFPVSGLPIHSFQANGLPLEPKTPSSPCDHPIYLDLTDKVNEIPEVSEKCEAAGESRDSTTPLPPPPPGMCIPFDYVNFSPPSEPVNDLGKSTASEARTIEENSISNDLTSPEPHETNATEMNRHSDSPSKDKDHDASRTRQHDGAGNSEDYVRSDSIANDNSIGFDVTDSPRLPEYMNIAIPTEQEVAKIIAGLPQKIPAPPVPPRGESSLAR
ncbi:mucin-5AC isoform X2 [Venturia canescens]|uniref:mucin-5AC isoform X2 n=1 Tax=Venturia canescens TaxID=32260 RepID=UPI001C9C98D5|nr:mucin-5AC isoform X2 [Venturia canescens]